MSDHAIDASRDRRTRVGRWWTRWASVVHIAGRRIRWQVFQRNSRQTLLSIGGIAIAVALMLLVTSVGFGLATQGTVQSQSADFRIIPAGGQSSVVTGVGDVHLGHGHSVSDRLAANPKVRAATPVLVTGLRLQAGEQEPTSVLVIGIVPSSTLESVAGLPTTPLTPGDPYYANGSYNGTWTGEAVLSASAADALNASASDSLTIARRAPTTQSFTVTAVRQPQSPGVAQFPVVIVHLAELQTVSGLTADDQVGQILVDATDPSVKADLAGVYPETRVVERGSLLGPGSGSSELPLAMSIAAGIVALVVGVLVIVTTVGFAVAADADERAVLAALGLSRTTRTLLVVAETLVLALAGGVVGICLWLGGLAGLNLIARTLVHVPVAVFRPVFAGYGLAVALLTGLLALPVLLVILRRTHTLDALPA